MIEKLDNAERKRDEMQRSVMLDVLERSELRKIREEQIHYFQELEKERRKNQGLQII